jgi:hypothetical protein
LSRFIKSSPVEEKIPLIFASEYMSKACAFGFRGSNQEKFMNSAIEGTDAEMVLLCDRDKTMSRPRDITVYSFADPRSGRTLYHGMANPTGDEIRPSTGYGAPISEDIKKRLVQGEAGFFDLTDKQRQCVSAQPVPFSKTQVAVHATSAEDMMRAGLQILIFRETFTELMADYDFNDKIVREKGFGSLNEYLGDLLKKGKLIWENRERGINPNPVFAQQLGIELKLPQRRPTAKKPPAHKP